MEASRAPLAVDCTAAVLGVRVRPRCAAATLDPAHAAHLRSTKFPQPESGIEKLYATKLRLQ